MEHGFVAGASTAVKVSYVDLLVAREKTPSTDRLVCKGRVNAVPPLFPEHLTGSVSATSNKVLSDNGDDPWEPIRPPGKNPQAFSPPARKLPSAPFPWSSLSASRHNTPERPLSLTGGNAYSSSSQPFYVYHSCNIRHPEGFVKREVLGVNTKKISNDYLMLTENSRKYKSL